MPWELSADLNGLRLAQLGGLTKRCLTCGLFLRYDLERLDSKRKATPGDLTSSLEFLRIASPKFKAVFDANGFRGVHFKPLSSGQYLCIFERRVRLFQQEKIPQHTGPHCPNCDHFEEDIVTTFDWALAEGEHIDENEIVESDMTLVKQELDCRRRKHLKRNLIVGDKIAAALKAAKLRRVIITPLLSREEVRGKPPYLDE